MPVLSKCPHCGNQLGHTDTRCSNCGAILNKQTGEDEFSELDYRPKNRRNLFVPLLIITAAVLMITIGILVLRNDDQAAPDRQPFLEEETVIPDELQPEPEPPPEPELMPDDEFIPFPVEDSDSATQAESDQYDESSDRPGYDLPGERNCR